MTLLVETSTSYGRNLLRGITVYLRENGPWLVQLCQMFEELGERKVDLVSMKDGFSLASPAGRLHARILASVAEYETEVRAERVAAGQAVARRKGKKWGGSKKGWRWKVSDDQVTAIREMKAAGRKVTHIAGVTGLSRPTIYRVLRQCGE